MSSSLAYGHTTLNATHGRQEVRRSKQQQQATAAAAAWQKTICLIPGLVLDTPEISFCLNVFLFNPLRCRALYFFLVLSVFYFFCRVPPTALAVRGRIVLSFFFSPAKMAKTAETGRINMANDPKHGTNERDTDNGQKKHVGDAKFEKALTVNIELLGDTKIPTFEVIQSARLLCGGLLACRSIAARKYELTMSNAKGKERLLEGFKIGDTVVVASQLANDEMVVSFLNLPAYIEDNEILEKLRGWGVQAASPIRRRMWPGTRIADGTRFLMVKFNDKVQSLPYSTKFNTALGAEYFRVIHDKQIKVCRLCIQPGHILRDCPEFSCHKCGVQGHYARECSMTVKKCKICLNNEDKCICNESEEGDSEELFEDLDMEEEGEESDEQELSKEGELRSKMRGLTQAIPAPPGAGSELGSSLESMPNTVLESRSEAREEAASQIETNPLPQRPAEGSRRSGSLNREQEMTSSAAEQTVDGKIAPPNAHPSSQNSEEEMDLVTLKRD